MDTEQNTFDQAKPTSIHESEAPKDPSNMSPKGSDEVEATNENKSSEAIGHDESPAKDISEDKSPAKVGGKDESPAKVGGKDESPAKVGGKDESPAKVGGKDESPAKAVGKDEFPAKVVTENKSPTKLVDKDKSTGKAACEDDTNKDKAEVGTEDAAKPLESSVESGSLMQDDETLEINCDDTLESPDKRKPRKNRRGVHTTDSPSEDSEKSKSGEEAVSDPEPTRKKVEAPRRIISLASVKKSPSQVIIPKEKEKRRIALKRKPSTSYQLEEKAEKKETSPKAPPKKKYKPITWP